MTLFTAGPDVADAEAALRFVFDAWAALPPEPGMVPDPADLTLHQAFSAWRKAKAAR